MNLTTLSFQVDSSALLRAKEAVDNLSSSVARLNGEVKEEVQTTNSSVKPTESATKAKSKQAAANEEVAKSTNKVTAFIAKLTNTYIDQANGATKGESAQLNYARSVGATSKQLEEIIALQAKIGSLNKNPFDASLGSIRSISQELEMLKHRANLADDGITLSSKHMQEFGRISAEVTAKLESMGVDITSKSGLAQLNSEIERSQKEYLGLVKQAEAYTSVEKEAGRVSRERANALRYLETAEEKTNTLVATYTSAVSTGGAVTERAAASIATYALKLKQAGIEGATAAKMLDSFSAKQRIIASQEQKQREAYLTRAIIPQFSDIFVGLTTGQNPMTVALQQLPQIQDLFTLTGVKAEDTVKVIGNAASEMVTRLKGTAIAVTQAIGLGFLNLGNSAVGLIAKFDPLTKAINKFKDSQLSSAEDTKRFAGTIALLDGIVVAVGVSLVSLAAIVGAVGVAMYKTAKDNDALLVSIVTTGASLGMTSSEVAKYAESMNSFGNSASDLKVALSSLASEGFKYKDSLDVITQAAQRYARVTGKELNDVLKEYAKVAKDPIDSLVKLGEATGLVDIATLDSVQTMLLAGDTAGATALALEAYANAQVTAAQDIERGLSPLGSLYLEVKDQASSAWDSISEIANSQPVVDSLKGISLAIVSLIGVAREVGITFNHSALALYRFLNPFEKFDPKQAWKDYTQELNAANIATTTLMNNIIFGKGAGANRGSGSAGVTLWDNLNKSQKEYSTELEKHEQKMAVFRKYRQDAEKIYATDLAQREKALGIIAGLENAEIKRYEESQKKKTKKNTDAAKTENYYASVLERISDLNVKNTVSTENLTKAEQILLDLKNDPRWVKLTDVQRLNVENKIKEAKAIELVNNQLKLQKQFSEEVNKLQSDYQIKTRNDLDEIANKSRLIGLTENEKTLLEAKLKVEKERKVLLDQINAAYEKSLAAGNSPFEAAATRQSAVNQVNTSADQKLTDIQDQTKLYLEQSQSFSAGWSEAFAKYRSELENTANMGADLFNTLSSSFSNSFMSFVNGTMTAKEAFRSFAASVVQEMLKIMAQQLAMKAIGGVLGSFFGNPVGALLGTSYGTTPFSQQSSMLAAQEFASGGYTGPGGVNQLAGVVHKGEVVWSQQDVARAGGVSAVEAMRTGKGYSGGGLAAPSAATPVTNNIQNKQSTKIINVLDPTIVGSYLNTDEGERLIVNVMQKNQRVLTG